MMQRLIPTASYGSLQVFDLRPTTTPRTAEQSYNQALFRNARGELELAKSLLDHAIELRPNWPEALLAREMIARDAAGGRATNAASDSEP